MKVDWRRHARRQIGHSEGLIVTWRDPAEGRGALVLVATACDNPRCDCRDVTLDGLLVDRPFARVRTTRHGLQFAAREAIDLKHHAHRVSFRVDVESGTVTVSKAPSGMDAALSAWLSGQMDDRMLDFLWNRVNSTKGWKVDPVAWRTMDWDWWEPGLLVPYDEAFPRARPDGYVLDGACHLARLYCCVVPDCDCDLAQVEFVELAENGEPRPVGVVVLDANLRDMPACPGEIRPEPGRDDTLNRLWEAFRARHREPRWLIDRLGDMRAFGGRDLMPHYQSRPRAAAPAARVRVGRNDPCPCGSGKKYKKCCGR